MSNPMRNFHNKIAVITGAASGIGKALAEKCLQNKMKVVLADINSKSLLQCENELKEKSDAVISVVTDVSKQTDITNLAKAALNAFGEVHLLFNNAGIPGPVGSIWETDVTNIAHVMQCNLMSVVYGLQAFIPIMLKQADECHIVNTASGAGLQTGPSMAGYMMSKHAVVALSEVLYYDLQKMNANIHVSLLCPGLVATNFSDMLAIKETDSADTKHLIEFFKTQMKKRGKPPEHIANEVFKAIESNQFYILPHIAEHEENIRTRMENIVHCKNPTAK